MTADTVTEESGAAGTVAVAKVTVVAAVAGQPRRTVEISSGELPGSRGPLSKYDGDSLEAEHPMGSEPPTQSVRSCWGNLQILEDWLGHSVVTLLTMTLTLLRLSHFASGQASLRREMSSLATS